MDTTNDMNPSTADRAPGRAVAVIGELLVDIVHTPDGNTAEHVGGSPANVALGLSRLGHETWFATLVGTDDRGIRCAQHVEDGGVHLLPGSISDTHPTSTAEATIDDSGAASYVFDLHWGRAPVELPPVAGHLPIGSLGTALRPGAVVERGKAVGASGANPAGTAVAYFEVRIDGRPVNPVQWLKSTP